MAKQGVPIGNQFQLTKDIRKEIAQEILNAIKDPNVNFMDYIKGIIDG